MWRLVCLWVSRSGEGFTKFLNPVGWLAKFLNPRNRMRGGNINFEGDVAIRKKFSMAQCNGLHLRIIYQKKLLWKTNTSSSMEENR